jgi:putative flippase GtrA
MFRRTEHVVVQLPRALIVAVIAAGCDFLLLIAAVELLNWHPLVGATVSYLAGGVVQYLLCCLWVFPASPQRVIMGFTAFTLLSLVGLVITWATIALLADQWSLNYALAKIVALALSFFWNFFSRKLLLFRPASAEIGLGE